MQLNKEKKAKKKYKSFAIKLICVPFEDKKKLNWENYYLECYL